MDKLKHAQRVLYLFRLPRIAADHRNAEHLGLRRLQQHHHRHLVGAARARAVLVDDHHPSCLGVCGRSSQNEKKQGTERP